jgi:V8-like Glu-specific endopeptidase
MWPGKESVGSILKFPIKKVRQLVGEDAELTRVFSGASEAVFPILKKLKEKDTVIGTGFFIAQNVFVTARHVLDEEVVDGKLINPIGAIHLHGSSSTIRSMTRGTLEGSFDIAGCVFQPMHKDGHQLANKVLPLRTVAPKQGDLIAAYAFPNHDYLEIDRLDALSLWPSAYPGKLIEKHENRGPSVKLKVPYFQTDMHLHPTASGAPVFDSEGKVWGVCSCSYDGATDFSFVTPIAPILGLLVSDVILPPETSPRSVTVAELAHRGLVSIEG